MSAEQKPRTVWEWGWNGPREIVVVKETAEYYWETGPRGLRRTPKRYTHSTRDELLNAKLIELQQQVQYRTEELEKFKAKYLTEVTP